MSDGMSRGGIHEGVPNGRPQGASTLTSFSLPLPLTRECPAPSLEPTNFERINVSKPAPTSQTHRQRFESSASVSSPASTSRNQLTNLDVSNPAPPTVIPIVDTLEPRFEFNSTPLTQPEVSIITDPTTSTSTLSLPSHLRSVHHVPFHNRLRRSSTNLDWGRNILEEKCPCG
jgi:hypothetical protein